MSTTKTITTTDDFATMAKAISGYFHNPFPALRLEPCGVDEWCVVAPHTGKLYGTYNHYHVVRQGTRYRLERRMTSHHPRYRHNKSTPLYKEQTHV